MGKIKVNGERYLGLADEAVRAGPGGMKPLDAFVEQILRSDLLWLAERGSQVSWSPLCTDSDGLTTTGHRPYASADWSSVLCLPWIVQPNLTRITLAHHSAVGVADGVAPAMVQRLRLLGLTPGITEPLAPGSLSQHDATCALAAPAPRRLTTSLVWEIKSYPGDDVAVTAGDGAAQSLNRLDAGSSNPTFYRDLRSGTHPSINDLGLQATYDSTAEGVGQQAYDHLYTREAAGSWAGPWNARKMTVRSAGVLRAPGQLTRRYLSYMQTRGGELREHYDATRFHRPRDRYLARQAVEAKDVQAHLLALRAIFTRARCIWAGPIGERQLGEPPRALWPQGYTRRHIRAQHDGGSDPNVLFWASCQLRSKNPKITVMLNVLAIQYQDLACADRDELDDKSGSARWVLDVKVCQYQGGTEPDLLAELSSEEIDLVHYLTDTSGQWTSLLQERVRAVEGIDGYTYKEGQLYEEDYALLQRMELTLDVPFDPAGATPWPILVRVGVRYVAGSQVRQVEPPDVVTIDEASDLALVCVGATIWEEPQL